MSKSQRLFSLTIYGYRKPGMDEDEYHKYLTEHHAQILRDLLAKNKIVHYTMQHNTTEAKKMIPQIFGEDKQVNTGDCDCVVQIVFHNIQDYLNVRADPHFRDVVNPDHANFADGTKTQFVTGWYEAHILNGQVV